MQDPLTPIIIDVADPVTAEITISDVLVGVFSLAGVMIAVMVGFALLVAAALIGLRRLRSANSIKGADAEGTSLGLHIPSR